MRLVEMAIKEYAKLLATKAPAPGGGAVAALTGAQGAALSAMVCDLTCGKERYEEFEEECAWAQAQQITLLSNLLHSMDVDALAYSKVAEAYKMPKDTEEEKQARSEAIQKATVGATEAPFELMELAYQSLLITEKLVGRSNPNAISDLGVAALNLDAAIRGAWLNVKINLPGLKDKELEEKFATRAKEIMAKASPLAQKIYEEVEAAL